MIRNRKGGHSRSFLYIRGRLEVFDGIMDGRN